MSLFSKKHLFRGKQTGRQESKPSGRSTLVEWPTCNFCSMPARAQCEFPGCQFVMCDKHVIKKGGGKLCPDHKGARLIQDHAHPDPGSIATQGKPGRFKAKGPALPNPKGESYAALLAEERSRVERRERSAMEDPSDERQQLDDARSDGKSGHAERSASTNGGSSDGDSARA